MGALFVLVTVMLLTVLVIGPFFMGQEHRKRRAEKLALMKEYPHLAAQIYESIEAQDAQFRVKSDRYLDDLGRAFTPIKKQKPNSSGAALKTAMSVAKRLLK